MSLKFCRKSNLCLIASLISLLLLTSCTRLDDQPTIKYTDKQLYQLEKEIEKLSEDNIIIVFLDDYMDMIE